MDKHPATVVRDDGVAGSNPATPTSSCTETCTETPQIPALFCKQCKRERPSTLFLWNGRKGRIRVRFCGECASANMRRYWSTRMVGKKPEEFNAVDD